MDKMQMYVEGALEGIRAQRAEEALKELAKKQAQAEKDALRMAAIRQFVEQILPEELLPAVRYPVGRENYGVYPTVAIEIEGCVPVLLGLRYSERGYQVFVESDEPYSVAALEISEPFSDGEEVFEGTAKPTWEMIRGMNQRNYCQDVRTAVGIARERMLLLVEAEAENKRKFDELTLKVQEKKTAVMREIYNLGAVKGNGKALADGEHVYVPMEALTPEENFAQAFHDYMRYLVGSLMREGQE